MENTKKNLESVQETTDASNQSPTGADTEEKLVDKLRSPTLLNDRRETNAVDEYRYHHISLDVERMENLSSSALLLPYKGSICERDSELNEYCLLEIFSYLSMDDMTQVKRVCNKWYEVSQRWFKQVQTLVYLYSNNFPNKGRLKLYEKYYKRKIYDESETKKFVPILRSYGHHIKYYKAEFYIEDEYSGIECEKFIFKWIPKLCENIVDLKIYNRGIAGDIVWDFEVMTTHWRKLEKIEIQYFPPWGESTFNELLRNSKQLKTLVLDLTHKEYDDEDHGSRMKDEFFTYLPTTIKEISITGMLIDRREDSEQLSNFISTSKNFTSLQSLELSDFRYLSNAVVAAIADIESLTDLSLCDIDRCESRTTMDSIANLKGLKSLNISDNKSLHEKSFINILESCIQLEQLVAIRNEKLLTNKGMAAIAKLEKLKCLEIELKDKTNKLIFNPCDSLEVFMCFTGISISDAIKLLKRGMNLKFFLFPYKNLMKDFLQAAIEIANERKNILCIASNFSEDDYIDTPYLKYFSNFENVPLKIFPKDIRCYIKRIIDKYSLKSLSWDWDTQSDDEI